MVSFLHLTMKLKELPKFVVVANAQIANTCGGKKFKFSRISDGTIQTFENVQIVEPEENLSAPSQH